MSKDQAMRAAFIISLLSMQLVMNGRTPQETALAGIIFLGSTMFFVFIK